MSQSYRLLNNKDNVIRRKRRHLMKMDSNVVKIEKSNDMNNEIETKPKSRCSMWGTKSRRVDEHRWNMNELREKSSYNTHSRRGVIFRKFTKKYCKGEIKQNIKQRKLIKKKSGKLCQTERLW